MENSKWQLFNITAASGSSKSWGKKKKKDDDQKTLKENLGNEMAIKAFEFCII